MSGYTRQDSTNKISNGSVIDADDLDLEFNAVEVAFNTSTGHTHSGAAGEGAPVTVLGPEQELRMTSAALTAKTDNSYDIGTTTVAWKDLYLEGVAKVGSLTVGGTAVTATATELNVLDGLTASTVELNYVDGVTSSIQTQLGSKQPLDAGLTSLSNLTTSADKMVYTTASDTYAATDLTSAGRALLDDTDAAAQLITLGLNATAAEINLLDGVTASTTEINLLDGVTASTVELNYVDGVTAPIQTQFSGKQPLDSDLTALANLATTGVVVRTGTGTAATRAIGAGIGLTISNGTGVAGDPTLAADLASQVEAETGTDNTKLMTPLRVKQAVDDRVSTDSDLVGVDPTLLTTRGTIATAIAAIPTPSAPTTAEVLSATAGGLSGAVGTEIVAWNGSATDIAINGTIAGSSLYYNVNVTALNPFSTLLQAPAFSTITASNGLPLTGTWRARTACPGKYQDVDNNRIFIPTLWLRIS